MKTIQDARKAFDALKRVYVLTGSQVAQTLDSFLSRLESKIPQTWLGVSNDDEGFILDNAMQHGFEMLDDDGGLYIVPAPELIHYTRVQREDADRQRDCLAAERYRADAEGEEMTSISAVEMLEQYQTENDRLRAQLAAMRKMLEGASKNSKRYLFLRDMSGELDVGTVPTVRPLPSQSDDYWALCGEVLDAAIDAQLNALAVDQVADSGKAMCSDGGECGLGGYCDDCKAGVAKPSPSDTDRLRAAPRKAVRDESKDRIRGARTAGEDAGHDEGFMDRWQNACGNLADLTETDLDAAIDEARNANPT